MSTTLAFVGRNSGRIFLSLVLGASLVGCFEPSPVDVDVDVDVAGSTHEVVYGVDDRVEYYQTTTRWQDHTRRSVLGMVARTSVQGVDPPFDITAGTQDLTTDVASAPPLGCGQPLCAEESFSTQPVAVSCSGTLIADDLLITVGHCIDPDEYSMLDTVQDVCNSISWVFDFYYTADSVLASIDAEDAYNCQSVVAWGRFPLDYAVIKLDRAVTGDHQPARIRAGSGVLTDGTALVMSGFPYGIPAKIDDGGRVVDGSGLAPYQFHASVDAFAGNSGSGVLDATTGELVGMLSSGNEDYVVRPGSMPACCEANVLPEPPLGTNDAGTSGGETVSYISHALEQLCATPEGAASTLCNGWCTDCATSADCEGNWTCQSDSVNYPGLSWCSPECTQQSDCRSDHSCSSEGICVPSIQNGCNMGDVWSETACGQYIQLLEDCVDDDCADGACGTTDGGGDGGGGKCEVTSGSPGSSAFLFAFLIAASALFRRRRFA